MATLYNTVCINMSIRPHGNMAITRSVRLFNLLGIIASSDFNWPKLAFGYDKIVLESGNWTILRVKLKPRIQQSPQYKGRLWISLSSKKGRLNPFFFITGIIKILYRRGVTNFIRKWIRQRFIPLQRLGPKPSINWKEILIHSIRCALQ